MMYSPKDYLYDNLPLIENLLAEYEAEQSKMLVDIDIADKTAKEYEGRMPYRAIKLLTLGFMNFDFRRYKFLRKAIKRLRWQVRQAIASDNDNTLDVERARSVNMEYVLSLLGIEAPKRGMIRCPLHNEKTASCRVYDDHIHCFGCGVHHDSIGLVMAVNNMSFKEAVEFLS